MQGATNRRRSGGVVRRACAGMGAAFSLQPLWRSDSAATMAATVDSFLGGGSAGGGGGGGGGAVVAGEDGLAVIGVFGLAVMGENLALNIAEKGFKTAVTNRSPERVRVHAASPSRADSRCPKQAKRAGRGKG